MIDETEIRVAKQMADISCITRNEVINCYNLASFRNETVTQV